MKFGFGREAKKAAARAAVGREVMAALDANPDVDRVGVDGIDMYVAPGFLSERDCDSLVALIDRDRRPSTLLSDHPDDNFRTSDSCDMDRWSDLVRPIDESIADLLGVAYHYGETIQGQRYAVGQQFRAHHDYFFDTESYWARMQTEGGQRTWTAMVFLNDVEEGGATWFPQAGVRIAPKKGLLLAWNNMNRDGTPNTLTLHEGMPVLAGTKYIITKWFREDNWLR